jgi:dTDP-4-amino-4,6-dideoxygalactose transaminase
MTRPIQFIDLKAQQDRIRPQIDAAIKRVLDRGAYIMGPEVRELEQELAEFCGSKHVITCANGTDALGLCLMAKGVSKKDAVFVPSFTFAATAEVVVWAGATPVFVDVLPDTYNMDPKSLEMGISIATDLGLKPSGVIAVDLFGQPADYDEIQTVADMHGLWIMADAAQSFGATYKGRRVGNIGDIATTSFFPAKPLGCYGDGGAVFFK